MKAPCLNCEDRHPCCHSKCEKYLAFKHEHDKLKAKLDNEKRQLNEYYSMKEDKYRRLKRR